MNVLIRQGLPALIVLLFPVFCLGAGQVNDFSVSASLLSFFNFVLLVMAVICIWKFFFPGSDDHATLHILNLIFVVLFYCISISFLVNNRMYYDTYNCASWTSCLKKVFFSADRFVIKHWIILCGAVINVLYLVRGERIANG